MSISPSKVENWLAAVAVLVVLGLCFGLTYYSFTGPRPNNSIISARDYQPIENDLFILDASKYDCHLGKLGKVWFCELK